MSKVLNSDYSLERTAIVQETRYVLHCVTLLLPFQH